MSDRQQLLALYENYLDACNAHDFARMMTFYAPDMRVNDAPMAHAAVVAQFEPIVAAFPDWHWDVKNIAIDGDLISLHFTVTGTHQGTFAGLPATQRRIAATEFTLYRVVAGKFADVWDLTDMEAVRSQLSTG